MCIKLVNLNKDVIIKSTNINAGFFKLQKKGKIFAKPIFEISGRSYSNTYSKINKKAYFANINGLFSVDSLYNKKEILDQDKSIFAKKIISFD